MASPTAPRPIARVGVCTTTAVQWTEWSIPLRALELINRLELPCELYRAYL